MSANDVKQMQLPLSEEPITIHCFFHCLYVAQSVEPQEAHDLMERHYEEKHARQIDRIIARYGRW